MPNKGVRRSGSNLLPLFDKLPATPSQKDDDSEMIPLMEENDENLPPPPPRKLKNKNGLMKTDAAKDSDTGSESAKDSDTGSESGEESDTESESGEESHVCDGMLTPPPSPVPTSLLSQDLPDTPPANWDAEQVSKWLKSICLSETYVEKLRKEEVDGKVLLVLGVGFLRRAMGMKAGPAQMLAAKRDDLFHNYEEAGVEESTTVEITDETDGLLQTVFVNAVKVIVYHLFHVVLNKIKKSDCFGCRVNHLSQQQHSCLLPIDEDFIQSNYVKVVKSVCNSRFVVAIQASLRMLNIKCSYARVKSLADDVLHDLKFETDISGSFDRLCEEVIGDDAKAMLTLKRMTKFWETGK